MIDPVLGAVAYLSRVVEPPCPPLAELAARVGPVEAADRVKRRQIDTPLLRLTEARHEIDSAARDLAVLERLGGRLVTAADAEWPLLAFTAFAGVDTKERPAAHPPLALWVTGPARLDEVAERAAAIVGTRAATAYGEHVAAELAAGLAERDVAVVSGGAYGVDGAAHRAALAADGLTVAVLAGGIDVSYPSGHAGLFHRIGEQGLIVTEYPPGLRPQRHRFLTRNRLVAALSGATVVVEAGARSGAANTAAWARALGRGICAVPGPVTSSASVGCHVLLRAGAMVVTRADEVLELVGRAGELAADAERPTSVLDGLADNELRVYDALPSRGARTVDEIAVASGLPPTEILGPLSMLEIGGLVVSQGGRWKLTHR
ncbi:DNA-processing protein DprA [Mycobacterium sp.]|jgi:DNA processing protein|uniref:DNA-processing protein DprA n=1 Tax=Mycobacterium sp. TaxID=1785 RepID=UPI002CF169A8|nr:DNA-processing protein DprA [Mycobacterium sp.]HTH87035.1 DNA-processing protein DprA [Mycobacterium sp.]